MNKFTSGPWLYTKRVGIAHGISTVKDAASAEAWSSIAKVWSADNACLIAAAPDLLTALQAIQAETRRVVHPDGLDDRLFKIDALATAALVKAQG